MSEGPAPKVSPSPDVDEDDPQITLFAAQRKLYPRAVSGIFRTRKWWIMAVCLALYYFAPFLRYDRGPNAPDQAILIDMVGRRAYWFFIEIWPQEVYFLTGILVLAAITMFFATSLFGRVWCGYFCFQTVWTDLFLWVERVVQGDSVARKKLDDKRFSLEWAVKKGITHMAWLSIGMFTGGAFVLYFNDAPTLIRQIWQGDVPATVAYFIFGLTFSTYLMAGFAREQVCTFMCPYARFQSAMFDEDSLIIAYDKLRGEPRGKHKKGESWDGRGHCIDCTQCVQVCPTGIDIRDGLQIQCIACGLCIDACDGVMEKIGLPKGLIRYDTERNLKELAAAAATSLTPTPCVPRPGKRPHLLRPRTLWYSAILLVVTSTLLFALVNRTTLELNVIRDRNPLFVQLSDGDIRNGYTLHILNKTHDLRSFRLSIEGVEGAEVTMSGAGDTSAETLTVAPDTVGNFRLFVHAPKPPQAHLPMTFTLTPLDGGEATSHNSVFISGGME